jgi:D-arabinose 1-dehydrogenase-like Zn-dependent alcohol dehydrogenase
VLIDPGTQFHQKIQEPADLALDCVGSPTINATLRAVRMGGRVVVVGNVSEARASINLGYLIVNGVSLFGSSGATAADMAGLLALHAAQPLDLPALRDRVMPLGEAEAAQQAVRAGGLRGRIVLDCQDGD